MCKRGTLTIANIGHKYNRSLYVYVKKSNYIYTQWHIKDTCLDILAQSKISMIYREIFLEYIIRGGRRVVSTAYCNLEDQGSSPGSTNIQKL